MKLGWLPVAGAAVFAPLQGQAAPKPAAEPAITYSVVKGDTLYDLARLYLVGPSAAATVQRLNRIADPRRLPVGKALLIPARLLRTEPLAARLVAFRGAVTIERAGRALPPQRGMTILEGDRLATAAGAFLTFELPDGSRTTLPSQSRVGVTRLRKVLITGGAERALRLEAGRSGSVVTPAKGPQDSFTITTPLTVSAVRGTDFRANYDAARNRASLEVIEGKVTNSAGAAEVLVTAGAGVGTTPQGLGEPRPLLAPPHLARGLTQDEPALAFALDGVSVEARAYRGQVAADAGFVDILAETEAAAPELGFPSLPNGVYFARFTQIDGQGLEGLPAVYAFERRLNSLTLDSPAAVPGVKRQYLFKWRSEGGGEATYRFRLSRDPDGARAVIDEPGLRGQEIVVSDLAPGIYYWRVAASRLEDGRRLDKWAPPQRFEIGR